MHRARNAFTAAVDRLAASGGIMQELGTSFLRMAAVHGAWKRKQSRKRTPRYIAKGGVRR